MEGRKQLPPAVAGANHKKTGQSPVFVNATFGLQPRSDLDRNLALAAIAHHILQGALE